MIYQFAVAFTMILSFGVPSYASDSTIGNGGDVVICYHEDGSIQSAEILDLWWWKTVFHMEPSVPHENDPFQLTRMMIERIEEKSSLASELRKYMSDLERRYGVLNGRLEDIPDHGDLEIQPLENCKIIQAAKYRPTSTPMAPHYIFVKWIWNELDEVQKSALIFHEIFYQLAKSRGHVNSKATRFFVGMIYSGKIDELTAEEFNNYLYYFGVHQNAFYDAEVNAAFSYYNVDLNIDEAAAFCESRQDVSKMAGLIKQQQSLALGAATVADRRAGGRWVEALVANPRWQSSTLNRSMAAIKVLISEYPTGCVDYQEIKANGHLTRVNEDRPFEGKFLCRRNIVF